MFNFSSESQKAMIGQPWTVPWALITQAAKTGLGWAGVWPCCGFCAGHNHGHTASSYYDERKVNKLGLMQCFKYD